MTTTDHLHPTTDADDDLVAAFAELPAANVGDAMDRLGALDSRIQSVWPGGKVCGRAFTVWTRPGDNLMIHRALEQTGPGDVVVVNGHGDESRALIGEMIGGRARARGVVGFVIDGAVRDAQGLADYGMPVFARALTPAGPWKHGPGRIGEPVACGGVVVAPGDIVVGDEDGVVVVPAARAVEVLAATREIHANEVDRRRVIDEALLAGRQVASDGTSVAS